MKAVLLCTLVMLAGCQQSNASSDAVDSQAYRDAENRVMAEDIRHGISPEQARARIIEAREMQRRNSKDPALRQMAEQRQRELDDLRADQCRRQPSLPGC